MKKTNTESHEPTDQTTTAAELIEAARAIYRNAYAPYSGYKVAAAVLADDRRVYTGTNVENAVYPLTMCAERVAIFKAIAAGARRLLALAVVTENAGTPCGSCRQVMREFGDDAMPVYISDTQGNYTASTLGRLLPDSFTASDLTGPKDS
ncbi:MAG: cytidine deaminase [Anaerolineae bacterium]